MGLAESWPVGGENPSVVTTLGNSYLTVVHGEGKLGPLSSVVRCGYESFWINYVTIAGKHDC